MIELIIYAAIMLLLLGLFLYVRHYMLTTYDRDMKKLDEEFRKIVEAANDDS